MIPGGSRDRKESDQVSFCPREASDWWMDTQLTQCPRMQREKCSPGARMGGALAQEPVVHLALRGEHGKVPGQIAPECGHEERAGVCPVTVGKDFWAQKRKPLC